MEKESLELTLRIGGALLTLFSAALLIVLGRVIGSTRLNKILYALIGFFAAFALLRATSGLVPVLFALIAANFLFLVLDVALAVQIYRLKRAALTAEAKSERAGSIDEAIEFVLAVKKEIKN